MDETVVKRPTPQGSSVLVVGFLMVVAFGYMFAKIMDVFWVAFPVGCFGGIVLAVMMFGNKDPFKKEDK